MICNLSRKKPSFFTGDGFAHYGVDLTNAGALALAAEWLENELRLAPDGGVLLINNKTVIVKTRFFH